MYFNPMYDSSSVLVLMAWQLAGRGRRRQRSGGAFFVDWAVAGSENRV